MLLSVHAIWGSASDSRIYDRAGKQNRQFIGVLVERFQLSATCFCTSSPGIAERSSTSLGHATVRAT
jgi:hypothetical protein